MELRNASGSMVLDNDTANGGINGCALIDGIGATPKDPGAANLPAGTYTIVSNGTAGAAYSLVLTKR